MTTSPRWEPRPGPTRGDTSRRQRPAVAGGWPADGPDGGTGGRNRADYDPRRQGPRGVPPGGPRDPRLPEDRPGGPRGSGPGVPGGPREPGGGKGRPGKPSGYAERPRPGDDDRAGSGNQSADGTLARRSGADLRDGLDSLRSSPLLRWLGTMSTRNAMLVLVAATLLGIVFTLFAGSEPGFVLGLFITVGSVAAALGVRRGAVYLVFPLPVFAFLVAAVITGKVKDSSLTASTTGLGLGFFQWIADIFFPMVIATILVLIVGGARWLLSHQLVTGEFPMSAGRQGAPLPVPASAPGPRRPASGAPWTDQAPPAVRAPRPAQDRPADRPGIAPRPGPNVGPPDRVPRERRTDRDPWGDDPRQSAADPRARDSRDGRPATPGQPRDRAPHPPARDPWAPPKPQQPGQPQRPPRPQAPRGPWDQRLIAERAFLSITTISAPALPGISNRNR